LRAKLGCDARQIFIPGTQPRLIQRSKKSAGCKELRNESVAPCALRFDEA